jgi:hypothetical protein
VLQQKYLKCTSNRRRSATFQIAHIALTQIVTYL